MTIAATVAVGWCFVITIATASATTTPTSAPATTSFAIAITFTAITLTAIATRLLALQCERSLFGGIHSVCFVEVSNIKSSFNARCSFSIACLASSGALNSSRCCGFLALACSFLPFTSSLLPKPGVFFTLARVFFAAARIFFTLTNIVLATARFALSVRAANQFRNAWFVGSWSWQIVKSTSECHGRCVSWRGLTTTATAAVSASIHHVIITIVIIRNDHAVWQIRKAWNRNAR